MREPDFLPSWYPQMLARTRMLVLQSWLMVVVLIGLAAWFWLVRQNVGSAQAELVSLRGDMTQADMELRKLDDLLNLQRQWRVQDQIKQRLGVYLGATRLVSELVQRVMPREMTLRSLSIDTDEQATGAVRSAPGGGKEQTTPRRYLRVRLLAAAPTDVQLANFLERLSAQPFFEQVSMSYAREGAERGCVTREFEVSFSVDLGGPDGN